MKKYLIVMTAVLSLTTYANHKENRTKNFQEFLLKEEQRAERKSIEKLVQIPGADVAQLRKSNRLLLKEERTDEDERQLQEFLLTALEKGDTIMSEYLISNGVQISGVYVVQELLTAGADISKLKLGTPKTVEINRLLNKVVRTNEDEIQLQEFALTALEEGNTSRYKYIISRNCKSQTAYYANHKENRTKNFQEFLLKEEQRAEENRKLKPIHVSRVDIAQDLFKAGADISKLKLGTPKTVEINRLLNKAVHTDEDQIQLQEFALTALEEGNTSRYKYIISRNCKSHQL